MFIQYNISKCLNRKSSFSFIVLYFVRENGERYTNYILVTKDLNLLKNINETKSHYN